MITGTVNAKLEPLITLTIPATKGNDSEQAFLVDTGYDGYLSLTLALIAALGLAPKASLVALWQMAQSHDFPCMKSLCFGMESSEPYPFMQ